MTAYAGEESGKGNTHSLWEGVQTSTVTIETYVIVPQKNWE